MILIPVLKDCVKRCPKTVARTKKRLKRGWVMRSVLFFISGSHFTMSKLHTRRTALTVIEMVESSANIYLPLFPNEGVEVGDLICYEPWEFFINDKLHSYVYVQVIEIEEFIDVLTGLVVLHKSWINAETIHTLADVKIF